MRLLDKNSQNFSNSSNDHITVKQGYNIQITLKMIEIP